MPVPDETWNRQGAGVPRLLTDKGKYLLNDIFGIDGFLLITGTTVVAINNWHGKLIQFSQGCAVTIPVGLRRDFSFGWSQEGDDPITFAAGDGATLQALFSLGQSAGQFADGGLYAVPQQNETDESTASIYRLVGALS